MADLENTINQESNRLLSRDQMSGESNRLTCRRIDQLESNRSIDSSTFRSTFTLIYSQHDFLFESRFKFRWVGFNLRSDLRWVESSVLADDSTRYGCIGHGCPQTRKHCFPKYFLSAQTSRMQKKKKKKCFAFLLHKRGNICRGSNFKRSTHFCLTEIQLLLREEEQIKMHWLSSLQYVFFFFHCYLNKKPYNK